MSDLDFGMESGLLDVVRWFGLIALFLASVLTLMLYGFHYGLGLSWGRVKAKFGFGVQAGSPPSDPSEGAATLLSWLLSLESWKRQWQKAWVSALNQAAMKNRSSFQLTIDNIGPSSSPLVLSHVTSVIKSEQHLVFGCCVTGEYAQFSIAVTQESPVAMGLELFNVHVSPLRIELEIDIQEADVVRVTWSPVDCQNLNLKVTPRIKKVADGDADLNTIHTLLQNMLFSARPVVLLTMKAASFMDNNIFPVSQNLPNVELSAQMISPPKPPRAHERKLQVKIIKVEDLAAPDTSESVHLYCVVELDNPVQKVSSSVMSNISIPLCNQKFMFELSAKSKKLRMQVLEDGRPSEILGEVTVPIDLFKKQPSGRQSFRLVNSHNGNRLGSITAEFVYMEPNEMKSRQSPSLLPAKKVEKDRTVMPCGTVVTTVTAVKMKPRTDEKPCGSPTDTLLKSSTDVKDANEESLALRNTEQGARVSKLLSSSDTELLHLSGTDPVAEAAIRQLTESAKHALKSPVKKSTIVISGVTKAPLTVGDEMILSANYTAAMDASLRQEPEPHPSSNSITELYSEKTLTRSFSEICATEETFSSESAVGADGHFNQWNTGSQEDLDFEQKSNISFGSPAGTIKKSRGGFIQSGAKFFFQRRHHQKEPGMSQSHNDLVYLEQPTPLQKERKSARKQIKRLFPKSKSKAKVNGSAAD